jgi:hypothetical protein
VLYLYVSKVYRVLHLPPRFLLPRFGVSLSPSAALHIYLLILQRWRSEGQQRGCAGASGWDAPGDCGTGASARSPLSLRRHVALQSPLVFYFTQDAKMVSIVGHDASPCSVG